MESTLLVASSASELSQAQHSMIAQVGDKLAAAIEEARSAKEMATTMLTARLDPTAAKRLQKRATSRVCYLSKVKEVLEAGYAMMPDMPGTLIAVRTDAIGPSHTSQQWRRNWSSNVVPDEKARALPTGAGRYISPRQITESRQVSTTDSAGRKDTHTEHHAIALQDPDGLDRRFIRPQVMSRTAEAMGRRFFDEIATVSPSNTRAKAGRRGDDPIVLGRVVDPVNGKVSAFLIAWFVDTATL